MEEMHNAVSKYYQEEFESVVKGLTSVIEPLMIVFVGGLIGVLVLALYMPIFNLGSTIK
jgi:type IV pilus assembly protein PilC